MALKSRKSLPGLFLSIVLLLITMAVSSSHGESISTTVMIYMAGSDLESSHGSATADLIEMLHTPVNEEYVNIIVFAGGSTHWSSGFKTDRCGIYQIENKNRPTEIEKCELMNMGESETLTYFINWGVEHYPAERYDLILWDHGAGPMIGVCFDQLFSNDMLTVAELRKALQASCLADQKKLEIIGFDACMMSSIEVAAACSPYANYMVASQELEPGTGWDYRYLESIEKDESGAETARRIIDTYMNANQEILEKGQPVTLSCLDLSMISETHEAFDECIEELNANISDEFYSNINILVGDSTGIGRTTGMEYDLVDLEDFLIHLQNQYGQTAKTEAALESLHRMTIYNRSNAEGCHGVTVYCPFRSKQLYEAGWGDTYQEIGFSTRYAEFLDGYVQYLTKPTVVRWDDLYTQAEETDSDYHFYMQLTDKQADNIQGAFVTIVQEEMDGSMTFVNMLTNATIDEHNILHAYGENNALFLLNQDGEIASDSFIRYFFVDNTYLLPCLLRNADGDRSSISAVISCRESESPGYLEIVSVYTTDDNMVSTSINLEDYDYVTFINLPRLLHEDRENGMILFENEERTSGFYGLELRCDEIYGFRLISKEVNSLERYAMFQIYDTQGNGHGSHPAHLNNRNITQIMLEEKTALECDELKAVLKSVDISQNGLFRNGILIKFELTNTSSENIVFSNATAYAVNNIYTSGRESFGGLLPGQSAEYSINLPLEALQYGDISLIEKISARLEVLWGPDYPKWDATSPEWYVDTEERISKMYELNFDLNLDVSPYLHPVTRSVLGAFENRGARVELLSARFSKNENRFDLLLHFINESSNSLPVRDGLTVCDINGARYQGYIDGYGFDGNSAYIECPPGTECFEILSLEPDPDDYLMSYDHFIEKYFLYPAGNSIQSIGISIKDWSWDKKYQDVEGVFSLETAINVPDVWQERMNGDMLKELNLASICDLCNELISNGDDHTASALLWIMADNGYVPAIYAIGDFCMDQKETDMSEYALQFYLYAANNGYVPAMTVLGGFYMEGTGVEQDLQSAADWYSKAAREGNLNALLALGKIAIKGELPDFAWEETAHLMESAASFWVNDVDAQYILGKMYEEGIGVEKDMGRAALYYNDANEQGNMEASYAVGMLWYNGFYGNDEFTKKIAADSYIFPAADDGLAVAQLMMGKMYESGEGVQQSNESAEYYYRLAAEQGNEDAMKELERFLSSKE